MEPRQFPVPKAPSHRAVQLSVQFAAAARTRAALAAHSAHHAPLAVYACLMDPCQFSAPQAPSPRTEQQSVPPVATARTRAVLGVPCVPCARSGIPRR
jgi:hypothetical protein